MFWPLIILVSIIFSVIAWLHWGKRGVYFAMMASYETLKISWKRARSNITEKELLIKTLRSRATYKNLSLETLEKIVEENPNIYSLIKFVTEDERVKSWKEYKNNL